MDSSFYEDASFTVQKPTLGMQWPRNEQLPQTTFARKKFLCPNVCGSLFTHRGSLTRHLRYECRQEPRFKCIVCEFRSRWTSDVYRHIRKKHKGCVVRCIDVGRR